MQYVLKRLLMLVPTLIGITLVTYFIIRLAPGDPVAMAMNPGGLSEMTPNAKANIEAKRQLGLDPPIPPTLNRLIIRAVTSLQKDNLEPAQAAVAFYESKSRRFAFWYSRTSLEYTNWFMKFAQLDFGDSLATHKKPVMQLIRDALPITLLLNLIDIIIVYTVALTLGVYSALKRDSFLDQFSMVFTLILYSIPTFWVGILLLTYFAGPDYLNWFPISGLHSDGYAQMSFWDRSLDMATHLFLPVVTMVYASFAFLSRFTRSAILEVVNQDYVRTAKAKGLKPGKVIRRHIVRNALLPLITLFGSLLPMMIGGSLIIEEIFGIPGMGKLGFESIKARDNTVVMAIACVSSLLTLLGILLADLAYKWVDPRITFERFQGK